MAAGSASERIAAALGELLGPDCVGAGEAARADFALDGAQPAVVAFPESPEQVAALLAQASREGWGVVPWGGGSGMGRGQPPARYDVAVSLSRLAELSDHDVENLTLTAGAGLTVAEANRRLAGNHQMLAIAFSDAPHTLGGCVAANYTAPRRLLYGEVRDQLLGLRVALADGSLVRYGRKVLKNVAGYDMNKLFLGSQGMLGVVVEATFKLFAVPDQQRCQLVGFPDAASAAAGAAALFRSRLLPAFLLLLDGAMAAQAAEALHAELPTGAAYLLVGFEGRAVALQRQLRDGPALLREHRAADVLEVERVTPELRTVLEAPAAGPGQPAGLRLRLGVRPTEIAAAAGRIAETLAPANIPHAVLSDYGAGQLRVAAGAPPEAALTALTQRLERLRGELAATRGYLLVESAPVALKAGLDALGADVGEARLMRVLKQRFDPADVLVPGRFLPAADSRPHPHPGPERTP